MNTRFSVGDRVRLAGDGPVYDARGKHLVGGEILVVQAVRDTDRGPLLRLADVNGRHRMDDVPTHFVEPETFFLSAHRGGRYG